MTLLLRHQQEGAKNCDEDWLARCIANPLQIRAERSSKRSLPTPPPRAALAPSVAPLVPRGLQCCSGVLLFYPQPGGTGTFSPARPGVQPASGGLVTSASTKSSRSESCSDISALESDGKLLASAVTKRGAAAATELRIYW